MPILLNLLTLATTDFSDSGLLLLNVVTYMVKFLPDTDDDLLQAG